MVFEIYVPQNLDFQVYLAVMQTLRVYADACDKKDAARFAAVFTPVMTVDYSAVFPGGDSKDFTPEEYAAKKLDHDQLGSEAVISHHLLCQPYFTSVTETKISLELQVLAAHGRFHTDDRYAVGTVSDLHWTLDVDLECIASQWKIRRYKIIPLYQVGDWAAVHRD